MMRIMRKKPSSHFMPLDSLITAPSHLDPRLNNGNPPNPPEGKPISTISEAIFTVDKSESRRDGNRYVIKSVDVFGRESVASEQVNDDPGSFFKWFDRFFY